MFQYSKSWLGIITLRCDPLDARITPNAQLDLYEILSSLFNPVQPAPTELSFQALSYAFAVHL